jgi:3-hydroxymyristoyl/3-hydroxydecanoyl-(acyl carrier protein) dehydratase
MKNESSLIVSPAVISKVVGYQYPIRMIDRVLSFDQNSKTVVADRHVSEDEAVFEGHFPRFKIWPGIYLIEGLKQSYLLAILIDKITSKTGKVDSISLQKHALIHAVHIPETKRGVTNVDNSNLLSINVKLLKSVYPNDTINYEARLLESDNKSWNVRALVNNKIVAEGRIIY